MFGAEQPLSFWMKSTLIPLDIMYFDAQGNFVSSATMEPCKRDPCPSYPSSGFAQFVLEMPAGYMAEKGIGLGWKMLR